MKNLLLFFIALLSISTLTGQIRHGWTIGVSQPFLYKSFEVRDGGIGGGVSHSSSNETGKPGFTIGYQISSGSKKINLVSGLNLTSFSASMHYTVSPYTISHDTFKTYVYHRASFQDLFKNNANYLRVSLEMPLYLYFEPSRQSHNAIFAGVDIRARLKDFGIWYYENYIYKYAYVNDNLEQVFVGSEKNQTEIMKTRPYDAGICIGMSNMVPLKKHSLEYKMKFRLPLLAFDDHPSLKYYEISLLLSYLK